MRFWLIIILLIPITMVQARPKIALVLSGGGAKGGAHIGVLKVLEDNNIPVDLVIGTSIGSYVGGLYAMGFNPSEISEIMLNTPFEKGYSDFIPREQLQYEDKQLRDRYNITLRLGYSDETLKMPSGLLLGQSALQVLKKSIGEIGELASFDQLPIPYRAVATDIASAKTAILSAGSLSKAIKASSTVPGALEPIEIDGRLLVDGGIVNNMPIDVAKSMNADIVIAVDIGSALLDQQEINSTVDVLDQLSNILTINTTNKQKKLTGEQDIIIRPEIEDIETTDFSRLGEALALGQKAALLNIEKLKKFSISESEYQHYAAEKLTAREDWIKKIEKPVIAIKYANQSEVEQAYITEHFPIKVNDIVNKYQLEDAIQSVYALDRFDFVNAEFFDTKEGRTIVLTTKAKSWGPDYLLLGFSWQGDFAGDSIFSVDFSYLLTDFTANGGSLKNEFSLGWENYAATELYQPFDETYNSFARFKFQYQEKKYIENKYTPRNMQPEMTDKSVSAKIGVGYHFTDNGTSEAGLLAQRGKLIFEDNSLTDLGYNSYGAYLSLGYDNLNSINFPTQGNKLSFNITARKDYFDTDQEQDNNVEVALDWRGALSVGNHAIVGIASASTLFNNNDFSIRLTELGGFLNLSGLQNDALIGVHKIFTAAVYQYDLGKDVSGGIGLPLYLGGSIESGNVWETVSSVSTADLITSGSLYLGTDTSFGPAVIGIGYATTFGYSVEGQATVFFSIGKNW